MPDSTPAPKPQKAQGQGQPSPQAKRAAPRKVKAKPQVISRKIFSDFASI